MDYSSFDINEYYKHLSLDELHRHSGILFGLIQAKHAQLYGEGEIQAFESSTGKQSAVDKSFNLLNASSNDMKDPSSASKVTAKDAKWAKFIKGDTVLFSLKGLLTRGKNFSDLDVLMQDLIRGATVNVQIVHKNDKHIYLINNVVNVGICLSTNQARDYVTFQSLYREVMSDQALMEMRDSGDEVARCKFNYIVELFNTTVYRAKFVEMMLAHQQNGSMDVVHTGGYPTSRAHTSSSSSNANSSANTSGGLSSLYNISANGDVTEFISSPPTSSTAKRQKVQTATVPVSSSSGVQSTSLAAVDDTMSDTSDEQDNDNNPPTTTSSTNKTRGAANSAGVIKGV